MISLHVNDSVVIIVTNVAGHVQRSCEAKVVICFSHFPFNNFVSTKKEEIPRISNLINIAQDIVCSC